MRTIDQEQESVMKDDLAGGHDEADSMSRADRSIAALVSDQIVRVDPSMSLRAAATRLRIDDVGVAVVGDLADVEGVISERDIVRAVALDDDLDETTVASLDSRDLIWATTDSTVAEVAEEMMTRYVRHVLIGDDGGQLVGIVSMRDILTAYLD